LFTARRRESVLVTIGYVLRTLESVRVLAAI
jgi:hypothetical protein